MIKVLGIEMITQEEIGKLIGTNCKGTISEWLARADITGTAIKKKRYYSVEQIKDYLRYGKIDNRRIIELMREVEILIQKRKKGENNDIRTA